MQEKICSRGKYDELKTICDIEFTEREVDVIACVLSGWAAHKSIAAFLATPSQAISPRTVETHLRNVMRKTGCLSQSGLIDFIEKSAKRPVVQSHYEYLQTQINFERKLATFYRHLYPKQLCVIYEDNQKDLIQLLLQHLELVGIKTLKNENNAGDTKLQLSKHYLYIVSKELIGKFESDKKEKVLAISKQVQQAITEKQGLTFLLFNNTIRPIPEEFSKVGIVPVEDQENYYVLFFKLLHRIDPILDLEQTILEFKKMVALTHQKFNKIHPSKEKAKAKFLPFTWATFWKKKKKWIITLITTTSAFLYLIDWFFEHHKMAKLQHPTQTSIHSNLLVPLGKNLLQRPQLMKQIKDYLNVNGGKEIRIVALVGIGGAGKTTMSRQYAMQQKESFIWEVNAETVSTLMHSFEKMAFALCQTEEDHKILSSIKAIQNSVEREEKILEFAKNKLQTIPNWLLIYDNVEKIADIQEYIPTDLHAWGSGRAILTTRDSHIQQNLYIHKTIFIDKLTPQEKLKLFVKILSPGKKDTLFSKEATEQFLEKIDAFPLDVSVAAFYLKATGVTYDQYLEELSRYNPDFTVLQEKVLKDATHYVATRYSIICLSIDKLLTTHKDFAELMLLISTIDSQNIPRSLLESMKDRLVVDNFIYQLKVYSLITSLETSDTNSSFSIHKSSQKISLQYLTQKLNLRNDLSLLRSIVNATKQYLQTNVRIEKFDKIRNEKAHFEALLSHDDLLTNCLHTDLGIEFGYALYLINDFEASIRFLNFILKQLEVNPDKNPIGLANVYIYLGANYNMLGDSPAAITLLERGLIIQKKQTHQDVSTIRAFLHLGASYRELGNYQKAKDFFEKSVSLYERLSPNDGGVAYALGQVGNMYRKLGNYQEAKRLLEKSIDLCHQHGGMEHTQILLGALGGVYDDFGDYEKAETLLEQSIAYFDKKSDEKWVNTMRARAQLGITYKNLGEYGKAKKMLEGTLNMMSTHRDAKLNSRGRDLASLGDVYRCMGNFNEALCCLQEAMNIYEKYYGPEHIETARVFKMLTQLYLAMGEIETAETYLDKSLRIFQESNHPEIYTIFEVLADFYLKKSVTIKENTQLSQEFRRQALNYLTQAQLILQNNFPKDSPHLKRVGDKLASNQ